MESHRCILERLTYISKHSCPSFWFLIFASTQVLLRVSSLPPSFTATFRQRQQIVRYDILFIAQSARICQKLTLFTYKKHSQNTHADTMKFSLVALFAASAIAAPQFGGGKGKTATGLPFPTGFPTGPIPTGPIPTGWPTGFPGFPTGGSGLPFPTGGFGDDDGALFNVEEDEAPARPTPTGKGKGGKGKGTGLPGWPSGLPTGFPSGPFPTGLPTGLPTGPGGPFPTGGPHNDE
ncbi:hypothetical protein F5883DRAFT_88674 [Diaporthe sp. PMI_573]|nr:hypothetical protein F5883DRAFT_88674 [Diaporthaceae sp. PMI_573]